MSLVLQLNGHLQHYLGQSFDKKRIRVEKRNADPEYFRQTLFTNFPALVDSGVFSLWQMRENKTSLIAVPERVNNALALCQYEELNRSHVYIRPQANIYIEAFLFEIHNF
jgi:hypothetical protein